jgi:hypothetical protein
MNGERKILGSAAGQRPPYGGERVLHLWLGAPRSVAVLSPRVVLGGPVDEV